MIVNKKILAIIPARGGSKGVKRKNLRLLKGKTLLAITIESVLQSSFIDRVIVSSEDEEILGEAARYGDGIPFRRPAEFATDESAGIDPVLHALSILDDYDYVMLLQVTSPLRSAEDIDNCITFCVEKSAPASVSVVKSKTHPWWMVNMNDSGFLSPFMQNDIPVRRQDLPEIYKLNGAVYFAKTDWFLKNKKFLSDETIGYEMPEERSLDIDTEYDLKLAEYMIGN